MADSLLNVSQDKSCFQFKSNITPSQTFTFLMDPSTGNFDFSKLTGKGHFLFHEGPQYYNCNLENAKISGSNVLISQVNLPSIVMDSFFSPSASPKFSTNLNMDVDNEQVEIGNDDSRDIFNITTKRFTDDLEPPLYYGNVSNSLRDGEKGLFILFDPFSTGRKRKSKKTSLNSSEDFSAANVVPTANETGNSNFVLYSEDKIEKPEIPPKFGTLSCYSGSWEEGKKQKSGVFFTISPYPLFPQQQPQEIPQISVNPSMANSFLLNNNNNNNTNFNGLNSKISLYIGDYKNDQKNCEFGVQFYENGDVYYGNWKDDKKSGKGCYFWVSANQTPSLHENNDKSKTGNTPRGLPMSNNPNSSPNTAKIGANLQFNFFRGDFKDGEIHGEGELFSFLIPNLSQNFSAQQQPQKSRKDVPSSGTSSSQQKDPLCNDPASNIYIKNYAYFTGTFQNGKKHGQGKLVCALEGTIYEGDWRNDVRHGRGKLTNFLNESEELYFQNDRQCPLPNDPRSIAESDSTASYGQAITIQARLPTPGMGSPTSMGGVSAFGSSSVSKPKLKTFDQFFPAHLKTWLTDFMFLKSNITPNFVADAEKELKQEILNIISRNMTLLYSIYAYFCTIGSKSEKNSTSTPINVMLFDLQKFFFENKSGNSMGNKFYKAIENLLFPPSSNNNDMENPQENLWKNMLVSKLEADAASQDTNLVINANNNLFESLSNFIQNGSLVVEDNSSARNLLNFSRIHDFLLEDCLYFFKNVGKTNPCDENDKKVGNLNQEFERRWKEISEISEPSIKRLVTPFIDFSAADQTPNSPFQKKEAHLQTIDIFFSKNLKLNLNQLMLLFKKLVFNQNPKIFLHFSWCDFMQIVSKVKNDPSIMKLDFSDESNALTFNFPEFLSILLICSFSFEMNAFESNLGLFTNEKDEFTFRFQAFIESIVLPNWSNYQIETSAKKRDEMIRTKQVKNFCKFQNEFAKVIKNYESVHKNEQSKIPFDKILKKNLVFYEIQKVIYAKKKEFSQILSKRCSCNGEAVFKYQKRLHCHQMLQKFEQIFEILFIRIFSSKESRDVSAGIIKLKEFLDSISKMNNKLADDKKIFKSSNLTPIFDKFFQTLNYLVFSSNIKSSKKKALQKKLQQNLTNSFINKKNVKFQDNSKNQVPSANNTEKTPESYKIRLEAVNSIALKQLFMERNLIFEEFLEILLTFSKSVVEIENPISAENENQIEIEPPEEVDNSESNKKQEVVEDEIKAIEIPLNEEIQNVMDQENANEDEETEEEEDEEIVKKRAYEEEFLKNMEKEEKKILEKIEKEKLKIKNFDDLMENLVGKLKNAIEL